MTSAGVLLGPAVIISHGDVPCLGHAIESYRDEIALPIIDTDTLLTAVGVAIQHDRGRALAWRTEGGPDDPIVAFAILSFGLSLTRGGVDLNLEALWIDPCFRSLRHVRRVWADIKQHARAAGAVSLAGVVNDLEPKLAALYSRLGCLRTDYRLFTTSIGP